MTDQRIYQIGLTMINGVGNILAHHLLDAFGDPERIFEERQSALEKIPGIGSNLACEIKRPEVLARAERELEFILDKRIRTYFWTDKDYPYRLKACADASGCQTDRKRCRDTTGNTLWANSHRKFH